MYSMSRQVGFGMGAGPGGPAASAQSPGGRTGWQARLLDFSQCRPDDETAQFDLSNSGAISALRVINARGVPADQLCGWMEAIGRMNGLQHLVIDVSGFTEAQYCAIAACLGPFSPIKVLELPGGGSAIPLSLVQAILSCQPPPHLCMEQPELLASDLSAPLPFQLHGETRVAERSMPALPRESRAHGDLQDLTLLVNGYRMTLRMSQLSDATEQERRLASRLFRLFACKPDGICSIEELMLLAGVGTSELNKGNIKGLRRMQALLDSFEAALSGGCVCEMGGSGYYQLVSDSGRASQIISRGQAGSKRTRSPGQSERDEQLLRVFTDSKLEFANGETLDVSSRTLTRLDGTKSTPIRAQAVLLILVCASLPGTVFSISDMDNILSGKGGSDDQRAYRLNSAVKGARNEIRGVIELGATGVVIGREFLKSSSRQRPESMEVHRTDQLSPSPGHFELPLRERISLERQRAAAQVSNRQSVNLPSANSLTWRIGQHEMSLQGEAQGMPHRLLQLFAIKPDGVCSIVELMVLTRVKIRSKSHLELRRARALIHEFNNALTGGVVCACEGHPGYCQLVKSCSPEEKAHLLRSRGIDETADSTLADFLDRSATLTFGDGRVLNALSGEFTYGDQMHGTIRRQALLIMLILASRPGESFQCSAVANLLAKGKNPNVLTLITKALEIVRKVMGELIENNGICIKLHERRLTASNLEPSTSTRWSEARVMGSTLAQESGDPK